MIQIFSPNMLKTYEKCPKKFYFRYIEGINVPLSFLPFEKGKNSRLSQLFSPRNKHFENRNSFNRRRKSDMDFIIK